MKSEKQQGGDPNKKEGNDKDKSRNQKSQNRGTIVKMNKTKSMIL